ncbi:MAG: nicotinamide mononucleotide transporter [Ruminococcaceae bacterium]|nr:nicotinamide mononucleotide transporter [Oscillospiraceae bacterium]
MKKKNPFASLTMFEKILWSLSVVAITLSFILCGDPDYWVLSASLIGATALIFLARGDVFGQLLSVVFSLLYGYISYRFRYYGEMITYLGMTGPVAFASMISWFRNPYKGKGSEELTYTQVKVNRLTVKTLGIVCILSAAVTAAFYFILKALDTPNLFFSTVSIATSFFASSLTFLRSPYYAFAYAWNDVVLIVLWVLAAMTDLSSVPMVMCFVVFLVNDSYAFISWRKMMKKQVE